VTNDKTSDPTPVPEKGNDSQADATAKARVIIDPAELAFIRTVAADHGVEIEVRDQKGFVDPATLMVVFMGSALAVATVSRLLEEHRGGQVLDLRPGAPRQAYRSQDVVYGLVVVISVEGTVSVEVKQTKDMFAVVVEEIRKTIVGLTKASLETVGNAVKVAVGDRGEVTLQRVTDPDATAAGSE
jgi:hypothetical protein